MSSVCDHQSILDRSQIRTISSKLAIQQAQLVKELTSRTTPSRSPSLHEFPEWFRVKSGLEQYTNSLQELLENVEKTQLTNSASNRQTSMVALQQVEEKQRIVRAIKNAVERLGNIEQGFRSSSFLTQAREVAELKECLKDLEREERCGLKLISDLKGRRTELQTRLERKICDEWRNLIKIEPVTSDHDGTIQFGDNFVAGFSDLFESVTLLNINYKILEEFSRSFLFEITEPLVSGKIECFSPQNSHNILNFKRCSVSVVKSPTHRLGNLITLFQFTENNLSVLRQDLRSALISSLSSSNIIQFAELVKSKSVAEMLPQNIEDFSRVKPVFLEKLRVLRASLVRIGWISENDQEWTQMTESLDDLHVAKSAQDVLIFARSVFVSEKEFLKTQVVGSKTEEKFEDEGDSVLTFFRLQEMTVSSTVVQVSQKSFTLLSESSSSSSVQLLISDVRNSLAMLLDVVPYCLKDRMINIPSIGALYFTSCMYASRQCILLNRIVQKSVEKVSETYSLAFTDLAVKLRMKAYETLNSLGARFSAEVLEILSTEQAAWLTKLAQNELFSRTKVLLDRSTLKRGIDIVRRLASVWKDILPMLVFQQAIGTIINTVMSDIVDRVIDTEEIGEADSKRLCDNFDWITAEVTEILKVGQTPAKVAPFKFVATWFKFLEVRFMLDARMGEVADRWSEGNGPLAEHLASEEVKKMVRALFDNNDNRAKLLAMIK